MADELNQYNGTEVLVLWILVFLLLGYLAWNFVIFPWIQEQRKINVEKKMEEIYKMEMERAQEEKERAIRWEQFIRQRNDAEQDFNAEKLRRAGKL